MTLVYEASKSILLKKHPDFNEKWVMERIAEKPYLLKIGDVEVIDSERPVSSSGRIDLLMRDVMSDNRYIVEIQLGKTDESHIIRSIEYWDLERKKYPHINYYIVLVAEEITKRFFNVISLFQMHIPLIAIKMSAVQIKENISLIFTPINLYVEKSDIEERPIDSRVLKATIDREYWVRKTSEESMVLVDRIVQIIKQIDDRVNAKYRKNYVGINKDGWSNNFVYFIPLKEGIRLLVKFDKSESIIEKLSTTGLTFVDYNVKNSTYVLVFDESYLVENERVIKALCVKAYDKSKLTN